MKLSNMPVKKGFRVRLMSPLGSYPSKSFIADSAALVVTPEVCFSIVRVKQKDWSFSEVDGLDPLEIPLLGSITLSGEGGDPYINPYPSHRGLILKTGSEEPLDDRCISECENFLLNSLKKDPLESYLPGVIHKPPALGGRAYNLVRSRRHEEQLGCLRRLETAGPVVLRGVGSLIKAHMAWKHSEFAEAACIYLWICLDAAHSLVLKTLRETGMENPTSRDAAKYFETVSGYNMEWERFFEDDYENRIRAIHPDNRFGAEARPQFLADDFLELNDMLIPLMQFLVLK